MGRAGKKPAAAAPAVPPGHKLFDLGAPWGKVAASLTAPVNVITKSMHAPGNFWPGFPARPAWKCSIDGYIKSLQLADGPSPVYVITNDGYHYPMKAAMLLKLLPKSVRQAAGVVDSDDEEADDQLAAIRQRTVGAGGGRGGGGRGGGSRGGGSSGGGSAQAAPALDPSRPAAAVTDDVLAAVTKLHGTLGAEGTALEGSKKTSKYVTPPSGWDSTQDEMKEAIADQRCNLGAMKLKDPSAQGVTRQSVKEWRLKDSFDRVFPIKMREEAAKQFEMYRKFQFSLGDAGDTMKRREQYWPEGGFTRAHYDAYICIIAVMGIIDLPNMEDYWSTNTNRYVVPFVRYVMPQDLFLVARHYAHFNDASKKVQRGDRSQPAPDDYDPVYNFRPMIDGFNKVWPTLVTLAAILTEDEKMIKNAMHCGLSRRQPNKPIRDGFQVYTITDSKGRWVYQTWFDAGELDPKLKPPYHFGKTIAYTLMMLEAIGASGTWTTLVMDQYFTSPMMFIILTYLKVKGLGTCQTNRRGWPSTFFEKKDADEGPVKEPGDSQYLFSVGSQGAISWALTACQWYDKNEVHLLTNAEAGEEEPYAMRKKGQQDAVDTTQPTMRKTYTDNKVGVDVVDQRDAALVTDHGSKKTPWHRVHDAYVNTAMNLAVEHYALVIEEFGSDEQKADLKKLRHDSVEARWRLLEELAEEAHFGSDNPNVSSLQRGRAQKNKPREDADGNGGGGMGAGGGGGADGADDDDDEEEEEASPPPRRTGRQRTGPATYVEVDEDGLPQRTPRTAPAPRDQQARPHACQGGVATTPGACGLVGCKSNGAMSGCRTCGYRFCLWACMNKHMRGQGKLKRLREEVEWKSGDWYD